MRAITKLSLIAILAVGLLAAPLALAGGSGGRETGDARSGDGKARAEEHRGNATNASHEHRLDHTQREAHRANVTAARAAWRENVTLVRESWHENATAIRARCHAAELPANATHEQHTAHAQCIKTGYASWREANRARLDALRDAFLALLTARGHSSS